MNADDFGMCEPVNQGIAAAFAEGVVSQASLMVPVPGFAPATELARTQRIPCGIHLVLASDWDRLRWRPLTAFSVEGGYFPPHVRDLQGRADHREVRAELVAQIEAALAAGITPTHLDSHILVFDDDLVAGLCAQYGLRSRDAMPFDSVFHLSPLEEKRERLLAHLRSLGDGLHLVVCHPAIDSPALAEMCSPAWPGRRRWAREYRISDLRVLMDADVRRELATFELVNLGA